MQYSASGIAMETSDIGSGPHLVKFVYSQCMGPLLWDRGELKWWTTSTINVSFLFWYIGLHPCFGSQLAMHGDPMDTIGSGGPEMESLVNFSCSCLNWLVIAPQHHACMHAQLTLSGNHRTSPQAPSEAHPSMCNSLNGVNLVTCILLATIQRLFLQTSLTYDTVCVYFHTTSNLHCKIAQREGIDNKQKNYIYYM